MNRKTWTGVVAAAGILALILDARTALLGAQDGIHICLYTVIPSLFPFLALSTILNYSLSGSKMKMFRPLGRVCGIPEGAESIFMLGMIGGYPVGAQGIGQAYIDGSISRENAQRMLAFCNNAGPAFIFGMLSHQFSTIIPVFYIWAIQMFSAIFVGCILPKCSHCVCRAQKQTVLTVSQCVGKSLQSMAIISGWVVLFRVLLSYFQKWVLWCIPREIAVVLSGLLELSNGCISLGALGNEALRFMLANVMLSFGGLCVCMQTSAVIGELKIGGYLKGKLLQAFISLSLSAVVLPVVFCGFGKMQHLGIFVILLMIIAVLFKIVVAFSEKVVYDRKKQAMR